jgi:C4-dicarboxylate transporter DctM subunit
MNVRVGTVFRGIIPFVIADLFNVALLVAIPQISLFLPNMMLRL